jgi:hypothetical protein
LHNKYSKLNLSAPLLLAKIRYTWRLVSMFCSKDHGTSTALKYAYKVFPDDIPLNEELSLNLLLELLLLVESKTFLLDGKKNIAMYPNVTLLINFGSHYLISSSSSTATSFV